MKYFLGLIFIVLVTGIFLGVVVPSWSSEKKNSQLPEKQTVIFIPGLDLTPSDYQTTINRLIQSGYVVKTYTPTYRLPENYSEMVDVWTIDIQKMAGKGNVIVIGHSVGGAVATHFCSIDTRCIKGINLDGSPAYDESIKKPFLYVQGGLGSYCDEGCINGRNLMEKITTSSTTEIVRIPEIKHFNFTDKRDPYLYEQDFLSTNDGREIIYTAILQFLKEKS